MIRAFWRIVYNPPECPNGKPSRNLFGLLNVDGNKRTLRFYVRQGDKMVLCPYWVIDERH
jgi:hypothetical protein